MGAEASLGATLNRNNVVVGFVADSPAERAELQVGDKIVKWETTQLGGKRLCEVRPEGYELDRSLPIWSQVHTAT